MLFFFKDYRKLAIPVVRVYKTLIVRTATTGCVLQKELYMSILLQAKTVLAVLMTAVLIIAVVPCRSSADTRYVSDMLIVTLREGKGSGTKVKNIKSNTPVEVLEKSESYLKVRTRDGATGWVHGQYITAETPKQMVIRRLRREIEALQDDLEKYKNAQPDIHSEQKKKLQQYREENRVLSDRLRRYEEEAESMSRELSEIKQSSAKDAAGSGNIAKLISDHNRLKTENDRLARDVAYLRKQYSTPRPPAMFWWFTGGAGVFLTGLLSGTLLKKKKYYIDV